MTQTVNKGNPMSIDPLFGLRIRRQPPQREGQTRRSTARVLKIFEDRLKSFKAVPASESTGGVLRQNDACQGGKPTSSEGSATSSPTPPLQNRQERPLEGDEDSRRPDTRTNDRCPELNDVKRVLKGVNPEPIPAVGEK